MSKFAIFAIVVVLPEPLIPTKHITNGFSDSFIVSIKFIFFTGNNSSKLSFSVSLIAKSIFFLKIGFSTNCSFKSLLILSITSKATLFSRSAISNSSKIESNCFSGSFFVVTFSVILLIKPFFSGSNTSLIFSSIFCLSSISLVICSNGLINFLDLSRFIFLGFILSLICVISGVVSTAGTSSDLDLTSLENLLKVFCSFSFKNLNIFLFF